MPFTPEQINGLLALLVAVAFGGIVIGQTTLAVAMVLITRSVLKSPVVLSVLEKLFMGLSPDWQAAFKNVVKVGEEVTDDTPVEQKALA